MTDKTTAKPPPSKREQAAIRQAETRLKERAPPILTGRTGKVISAPHDDLAGWSARVFDVFGTASGPFADNSVHQLAHASKHRGGTLEDDTTALDAALALVAAVAPQNEVEGALAVQMAQVHALTADLLGRARQTDRTDHVALYGNLAVKLSRTFAMQAEALHRIRGGGRQQIEVKHVHIGNAVIGDIIGAGGGVTEIGNQPLAKPIGDASVTALRGEDEAHRQALPVAQGEGSDPMPHARRRGRERRAER
jgi:hypothetical protein